MTRPGIGVIVVITLAAAGCGGGADDDEAASVPTRVEVTYENIDMAADAVIIEPAAVEKSLTSADLEAGVFEFEEAPEAIASLEPGSVVALGDVALIRVKELADDGNTTVLEGSPAALTDLVESGTIGFDHEVNFRALADEQGFAPRVGGLELVSHVQPAGNPQVSGQSGTDTTRSTEGPTYERTFEGVLEGWDLTVSLQPTRQGDLAFELTADYEPGGVKLATVAAEGSIGGFRSTLLAEIAGGDAMELATDISGLSGELEVTWAAAVENAGEALVDLAPIVLPIEVPAGAFLVGPIPVTLTISAAIRMVPELRFAPASSQGSLKATYDSDFGMRIRSGTPTPSSTVRHAEGDVTGTTNSAASVSTGLAVDVDFPKLELEAFGGLLAPYITLQNHFYSFVEPGLVSNLPPCQKSGITTMVAAGASASLFEVDLGSVETQLWERKHEFFGGEGRC